MALTQEINFTDAVMVVADGTGTPLTYTESHEEGGFSLSDSPYILNEGILSESRGVLKSLRAGARKIPQFSFVARKTDFSKASGSTLEDMIGGVTGTDYALRVFVDTGTEFPNFDVTITYTLPDASTHTIVLETWAPLEYSIEDGDGPVKVSYGGPVLGRVLLDGKVWSADVGGSRTP